jgi:hypothetical protein
VVRLSGLCERGAQCPDVQERIRERPAERGGAILIVVRAFWRRARARLKKFKLTKAEHAAAVATLSSKVPEMSRFSR